jgi:hypothetical protein
MASLACGFWPDPLAVIPCMSSVNSSLVFVGLISSVMPSFDVIDPCQTAS